MMRRKLFGTRKGMAACWTPSLLAIGALVALSSEQLLAESQKDLSDPCWGIVSRLEKKVSCASDEKTADGGFRVDEFQDFDLPSKTKIAFATIFNARAAREARVFNFIPLDDTNVDISPIDSIKNGSAYPAIESADGKYYVFTPGVPSDNEDWITLWNILVDGARDGSFARVGLATQGDDIVSSNSIHEKIFGWGSEHGLVLPIKE